MSTFSDSGHGKFDIYIYLFIELVIFIHTKGSSCSQYGTLVSVARGVSAFRSSTGESMKWLVVLIYPKKHPRHLNQSSQVWLKNHYKPPTSEMMG